MKNWKKLLLCIVISVLVTTFIGATLSVIKNRVIVHLLVKEEFYSTDNKNVDLNVNEVEEELKRQRIENMSQMYAVTAGLENEIYIYSIAIGMITGILIYLIFIKKTRAKKILLISLICFMVIFLAYNLKGIITDISDSTFELSNYILNNNVIDVLFVAYIIILVALYTVNFIHQKRIAKKLNKELDEKK